MSRNQPLSVDAPHSRRSTALLTLGAAAGIACAAAGLLAAGRTTGVALPSDAVARVNGVIIRAEDYERTLAGFAADRRDGVGATDRRHVIDRLIDEELLVQRGLELGLARHDRRVRSELTAAVIASVVSQGNDARPTDAELQTFYDTHRDFFAQPGRLRVRQILCRVGAPNDDETALARAREASGRLRAGEAFNVVQAALSDPDALPLPDILLPPAKLQDYLGPTALHTALALGAGEVSEPVRANAGYAVLQVLERQADTQRPFTEMKSEVLAEFRRQSGERALRVYLDDLRARADVVITSLSE